jgi:hypothetical protein
MIPPHQSEEVKKRFRLVPLFAIVFDPDVACSLGQLGAIRVDEKRKVPEMR